MLSLDLYRYRYEVGLVSPCQVWLKPVAHSQRSHHPLTVPPPRSRASLRLYKKRCVITIITAYFIGSLKVLVSTGG